MEKSFNAIVSILFYPQCRGYSLDNGFIFIPMTKEKEIATKIQHMNKKNATPFPPLFFCMSFYIRERKQDNPSSKWLPSWTQAFRKQTWERSNNRLQRDFPREPKPLSYTPKWFSWLMVWWGEKEQGQSLVWWAKVNLELRGVCINYHLRRSLGRHRLGLGALWAVQAVPLLDLPFATELTDNLLWGPGDQGLEALE